MKSSGCTRLLEQRDCNVVNTSSHTPKPRDNFQSWDVPLSSRLRTTCLAPSRVFLDSSTTGREAAGACSGRGVKNAEPRGSQGCDLSSSLISQTSLFQAQTVRLLFDPRIRPLPALPALREEPPSPKPQWLPPQKLGIPSPRPQETDSHSRQRLGSSSAHLPQGQSEIPSAGKVENESFPLLPQCFCSSSNGDCTRKSLSASHSILCGIRF